MFTLALSQAYQLTLIIHFILEGEETDFSGLGKLMLLGFVIAIGVAIAITFVRLRMRDKHPPAQFISINAPQKKD